MESIISYFGTYKPAADGAVASFKFEYLCTLRFRGHRDLPWQGHRCPF